MSVMNLARRVYGAFLKGTVIGEWIRKVYIKWENLLRLFRANRVSLLLAGIPEASVWKMESWGDYFASKGKEPIPLFESETHVVLKPRFTPTSLSHVLKQESYQYYVPEGCVYSVENAKLIGGSDFVFVDGFCLHNAHCDFKYDYTSEELHGKALISPDKRRVVWYEDTSTHRELDAGINLLGSCTRNYAHWLSESLPKLPLLDSITEGEDYPLLVDAALPAQIFESIERLNKRKREIIEIQSGERIRLNNLLLMEAPGYVPFQPRIEASPISRHGTFSTFSIKQMIEAIKRDVAIEEKSARNRIFLKRGNTYRALVNEDQVESLLKERGFIVLDPGTLSFDEQVKIFSNASMIVGPTGAGFANLLFAPEDCRTIILASANSMAAYYYWQILASTVGNSVSYVLGTPHDAEQTTVHADYQIRISDLLEEMET